MKLGGLLFGPPSIL